MNQAKKRLEELHTELQRLVDHIELGDVELLEATRIAHNCVAPDVTGISCLEKFPNNPDEWCSTCAYYIKRAQHTVH